MKYNLSPETIEHPEIRGFLSSVLSSLLNLRIETKRLKKTNKDYAGIDSVLKWVLVTCFGYTGTGTPSSARSRSTKEDYGNFKGAAPTDQGEGFAGL